MNDGAERVLGPHPGPGDTVGSYRLTEPIGVGGMASVYRALDGDNQPIAIKILNPARVHPDDIKRFTREYRALSRIDHENVVQVFGAGVEQGYPWIAMEFVDGVDLGHVIAAWKKDPPSDQFDRAKKILVGLCHALHYVHDLGMVHRDIKPTNVLITKDGEAKLSDFGVVKGDGAGSTHQTQLTMAGRLVGTVAFMAPELITTDGVDRRADLYALGACLYMMLTFQRPIEAQSVAGYLARHLTEVPRPASDYNPDIPSRLEHICQRLLLKDKTYRYPTARAVLQALDRSDEAELPPLRGRDPQLSAWNRQIQQLMHGAGGSLAIKGPRGAGKTHLLNAFLDHVTGKVPVATKLQELPEKLDEEPRILAVDDLDRVDHLVLEAIARHLRQSVVIEGAPLLLVYTATDLDGHIGPLVMGQSTGIPSDVIEIGAVDTRSVIAMVRDRNVTGPAAPILGRRLHAEYAGRPGPIVEQLSALVVGGWFDVVGDTLKPNRPLDNYRREELPVPPAARGEIEAQLDSLDGVGAEITQFLAILERAASSALLEKCASSHQNVPRLLDTLVKHEVLVRTTDEERELLQLSHPCAARVIRSRVSDEVLKARHRAVADALSARRRRASALEIATHRQAGGQIAAAYPLYVQAARRAARSGAFSEVLDITARAEKLRDQVGDAIGAQDSARLARWTSMLRGEAMLARGMWAAAIKPLGHAVSTAAEEGDQGAIARCGALLGRARYRLGQYVEAEALLVEALARFDKAAPNRATATRVLADIQLRKGDAGVSESMWFDALDLAIDAGSRDGEARARRGLAHLRAVQGRLQESGELLDQAEELLNPDGDSRVRAGVLARSVELDTCAGRFGSALRKSELLVDLVRRREMSERLAEAYALLSETLLAIGDYGECHDAAHQSLIFARAHGARTWASRLRSARVLCFLEKWDEVEDALPSPEDLPTNIVDDPAGQLAAIRARLYAQSNSTRARDMAIWTMVRAPPLLSIRAARIAIDASLAFSAIGQVDPARSAVKRGLKALQGPGGDGLRLELLIAMQIARSDPRVLNAAGQVADRVSAHLNPQAQLLFRARPVIAASLTHIGSIG